MKTLRHIQKLLDQLYETPSDWQLRLVVADAFEEQADDFSAECLRWMARNLVLAFYREVYYPTFCWYAEKENGGVGDGDIPLALFRELSGFVQKDEAMEICAGWEPNVYRIYSTCRHAEYALRVAWRKARRRGWVPQEEVHA